MARFTITKSYTMPKEQVRAATRDLAERFEQKHGISPRWRGDSVSIKGSGLEGRMTFDDGLIEVSVKLGLLASAFEPVLKKEVQKYLDKHVT